MPIKNPLDPRGSMKLKYRIALIVLILGTLNATRAEGTAFSYRGRLSDGGTPATGQYDLAFSLFSASSGAGQIGNAITNLSTLVSNGVFAVILDFGTNFSGADRWLEIAVRTNGVAAFTILAPRQAILPIPYAIHAATAGVANSANTVVATNIIGTLNGTQLPAGVLTNAETSVDLGGLTLGENLHLPVTTATAGIIYSGTNTLIHRFGTNNFYAGADAGNLTSQGGGGNVGIGEEALRSNTTGVNNTAVGASALISNTTGNFNTAIGNQSLAHNTSGAGNSAIGWGALLNNTTGTNNTGNGMQTLRANTTGSHNTASGFDALWANTTGSNNTSTGDSSLVNNSIGSFNTASGKSALQNSDGNNNTAYGFEALRDNLAGANNIALGYQAGLHLTNHSGNIAIGHLGVAGEDNTIHLGTQGAQTSVFIAGISGATAASGVAVYVDSTGHLGTLTSSAKFKKDIRAMDEASSVLLSLRPVTFRYKSEIDPAGIAQFGLVAEEVDKIDPDLVARDEQNQIYTVRYEAVNAMLLNEFLKQHQTVQKQKAEIENLRTRLDKLEKLMDAKTGGSQ